MCSFAGAIRCLGVGTQFNCVYQNWIGDGMNDCGNWWDEDPCVAGRGAVCAPQAACAFNAALATRLVAANPATDVRTAAANCTCQTGFAGPGFIAQGGGTASASSTVTTTISTTSATTTRPSSTTTVGSTTSTTRTSTASSEC